MKFPYVMIRGLPHPIIPVTLHRDGHSSTTDALVDSGATTSIFHVDYARDIGIDTIENEALIEFVGISGQPMQAYRHEVVIEIGGSTFPLQLAFSDQLSPEVANILGQDDFFALFRIRFTYTTREIHLMTNR